jgi:hypothetical protein
MPRKKWTPKDNVTDSLLQFREKRKWQIALRRYVLEKNKSSIYAPYFGLPIEKFRQWIQVQFDKHCSWENFSQAWQFDHIIPLGYFDFTSDADLALCWNFTNITIDKIHDETPRKKIELFASKAYFQALFDKTGYRICQKMLEKISSIEASQLASAEAMERFITENKDQLEKLSGFTSYDYDKLNTGAAINDVIYEKEFLKKFSG